MRSLLSTVALLGVGALVGSGLALWQPWHTGANGAATTADGEPLYWVAPMDANFRRDKPGKSPMGMDLIPVFEEPATATDANAIVIAPGIAQQLGVRTDAARQYRLRRQIETLGKVAYDEHRVQHVHSRVEGWVDTLYIDSEGEAVARGDKLFELYAPELVSAQEDYLAALRVGNRALVEASRQRLQALGMSARQIERVTRERQVAQTLTFYAEQAGIVDRLAIREGSFLQPNLEAITLADLASLWLIVEVLEPQLPWVALGQTGYVTFPGLPDQHWLGNVRFIYPTLDAERRTLRLRIPLDNGEGLLKPHMQAQVVLFTEATEHRLSIAKEAVIRGSRYDRVVVKTGDDRFEPRVVTTGLEGDARIAVLDGLAPGEQVVVSGQFLIDSEANIDAELQRLAGADPGWSWAHGLVQSWQPDAARLHVLLQPVPDLGWSAGPRSLPVAASLAGETLRPGEPVALFLEFGGGREATVTRIERAGATP